MKYFRLALAALAALLPCRINSATPQQLLNSAAAFQALSDEQLQVVQTYLAEQIAVISATPAALLASASAFQALSDRELQIVQTYLLSQITSAGGGGATNGIQMLNGFGTNTTLYSLTASNIVISGGTIAGDGSGLTNILTSAGTVFVRTNGNNTTGMRGQPNLPFKTLTAGQSAMVVGDTLDVGPGVYLETLYKPASVFKLDAATQIGNNIAGQFIIALTNTTMEIEGRGLLLGDIYITNSHIQAHCGLWAAAANYNGYQGSWLTSPRCSVAIWADVILSGLDFTTNLDYVWNADIILGHGQIMNGHNSGTMNCRRFCVASVTSGFIVDCNGQDTNIVNCAIADMDMSSGFQNNSPANYVVNCGLFHQSGAEANTQHPNLTINGGIMCQTIFGDITHVLGNWSTNSTVRLPNEPQTAYFNLIGF